MKILFSLDNYDHGSGGAEKCAQALARHLAARGHTVHVLQEGRAIREYADGPVRVHARPLPSPRLLRDRDRDTMRWNRAWRRQLEAFLADQPADLILTQNRLLPSTVAVAAERDVPAVVFLHAFGLFCPTNFRDRDALVECDRECRRCLPWLMRLKYGAVRRTLESYEEGLRRASLRVANSRYMQQVARRFYGLDSVVMYPSIDLASYEADAAAGEHDRVLFVKPQYVKGFPIFVEAARRMPETRFLVAGKASRRVRRVIGGLDNVECTGWVSDMRAVYARARVLLGPSIWPEPFGRVFVEAAANGVPSVASRRGGIPEAVGDAGILIDDIFDTERWVEALEALDDPAAYAARSAAARDHATRFGIDATFQQLANAVSETLGLTL